jgi:putative ATP-dependent endonuclease of the OLD family
MATLYSVSIKNFRGIKEFYHSFYGKKFICLIGRGDSGKSTILEAISYVLSSSWNTTFYDSDFHNCDTTTPIEIEATLIDLPDLFINEKFGLYIRGVNEKGEIVDDFLEEEVSVKAITIKLTVSDDLEPNWSIVNNRPAQEPFIISAAARATLNTFLISDYTDRHFSWSKGNPLYSLLKQEDSKESEDKNIILGALRNAKKEIDKSSFNDLKEVIKKISTKATELGIDISNTTTSIDFKDISLKDNRVCLHDDTNIPFRLKGKGLKRLVSIAIQTSLAGDSGIILIDEIEQGLEPDRVKHLVNTLKRNNESQIFITTHSRNTIVVLDAPDLFLLRNGKQSLLNADIAIQGCIRANPEALFAKKLLICEGATEIGICMAIDNYRASMKKKSAAYNGIVLVNGTGSQFVEYCEGFIKLCFPVCIFCDSDDVAINSKKNKLLSMGAIIIDCDTNNSIENQIFNDLPWAGIKELLKYRIEEKDADSVKQSAQSQYSSVFPEDWENSNTSEIRIALAKTAVSQKWFKSIESGKYLGSVICKYLDRMSGEKLKIQVETLFKYMD